MFEDVRFIAQQPLRRALRQRYLVPTHAYFWDALDQLRHCYLHGRLSWRRIATLSESSVQLLAARPPFILFTDHMAGWLKAPKRRRWSPVQLGSVNEALTFIQTRSHFRDGTLYEDNYYLCDHTFRWFIAFCHHEGWHLWMPTSTASKPSWRRWQTRMGVRSD